MSTLEAAAWVQAVGTSVAAVGTVGTFFYGLRLLRDERHQREREQIEQVTYDVNLVESDTRPAFLLHNQSNGWLTRVRVMYREPGTGEPIQEVMDDVEPGGRKWCCIRGIDPPGPGQTHKDWMEVNDLRPSALRQRTRPRFYLTDSRGLRWMIDEVSERTKQRKSA